MTPSPRLTREEVVAYLRAMLTVWWRVQIEIPRFPDPKAMDWDAVFPRKAP